MNFAAAAPHGGAESDAPPGQAPKTSSPNSPSTRSERRPTQWFSTRRSCVSRQYSRHVSAPPRSLPLIALVLGVVLLVVQIRVVAGGQTWDDVRYHTEVAPPRLASAEAVQHGDVPGWWDGSGLGVALAGEPSHGALYPPHWLAATPHALDLVLLAHLVWAALGVAVWARRRASDHGALLAGVLLATAGIATSAALRGALPALAHLPWLGAAVAWLGDVTTRRDRARATCAIGALIAAIALAGELALLIDAIAIAFVLGLRRTTATWLVAAVAAGLAIGAVQWIPAILQLPHEAGAAVAGLPLARLVELLVPGAFGGSVAERAIPTITGAAPWAPSLFIGAPLLALSAVRVPSRRLLGVIGGLCVLGLLAGRGGWPAWLGAPELHVAALAVVLAVPAADGLDALARGQVRAVLALALGAGLTALALAALGALRAQHAELARPIDRAVLDGALGVACIAGAVVLAWRWPGRQLAVLLALLVAPSVGAAHAIAPTLERSVVTEPPAWAQLAALATPPVRAFRPELLRGRPTLEEDLATFAGASAWRWGIAAAHSDDPARPVIHDRTWLAAASEGGALLDRFGIAIAILPSTLVGPHKLTALARRGGWALVTLPVAPAASVMPGWQWSVDPDNALDLMFPPGGGTGMLRGTIVLDGRGEPGPPGRDPRPCAILDWRGGDLALSCVADAPAYAVVSSTTAAGWAVTVDDQPARWWTADVLRRAVPIPAGTHRVHWTYTTPGITAGALVALLGLLGLGALAWLGRGSSRLDERS
jgi:hypothetical protein